MPCVITIKAKMIDKSDGRLLLARFFIVSFMFSVLPSFMFMMLPALL